MVWGIENQAHRHKNDSSSAKAVVMAASPSSNALTLVF